MVRRGEAGGCRARARPARRRRAWVALVGWWLVLAWVAPGRPGGAAGELLVGLPWESPADLETIAQAATRVRFVTRGKVLVELSAERLAALAAAGRLPFVVDALDGAGRYYLATVQDGPVPDRSVLRYADPAGWSLLRVDAGTAHDSLPAFLYELPETYSLRGWLVATPRAKPVAALGRADMAQLLERVDPLRIRQDILSLSQVDPAQAAAGNLRTRFTVHPRTREATAYIRAQLAAALGEDAVWVEPFAVSLDRLSGHLRGQLGEGEIELSGDNVVGELEGTAPGTGYYVVCGHYDATGVRSPGWNWRTDPAPGADDNATGAALVLEAARVLATQRFPWSIRFIAFSGEELGLLGSQAYAAAAGAAGDQVLGVLNFDMIGYNHLCERVEVAANPASRWLADLLVASSDAYGLGLRVDVLEDAGARASDHASFWARGFDAVLAIENYLPTDSTHYAVRQGLYRINGQYHTTADVADSLNWELVRKDVQLAVAALAQYAAPVGPPNLAAFTGDLRPRGDGLDLYVSNLGGTAVEIPFRITVARCGADSSGCGEVYRAEHEGVLEPGGAAIVPVPWDRLGLAVVRVEVDPDGRVAEAAETDNGFFQRLYVQPQGRVVVYPNPFRAGGGRRAVFTGLPLQARVQVFAPSGELVWAAQEDDSRQRRLAPAQGEVWWLGVNGSASDDRDAPLVGAGVYFYQVTASGGQVLARDKIAVLR